MNDEAKPSHLLTMTNIENFGLILLVLPLLKFSNVNTKKMSPKFSIFVIVNK